MQSRKSGGVGQRMAKDDATLSDREHASTSMDPAPSCDPSYRSGSNSKTSMEEEDVSEQAMDGFYSQSNKRLSRCRYSVASQDSLSTATSTSTMLNTPSEYHHSISTLHRMSSLPLPFSSRWSSPSRSFAMTTPSPLPSLTAIPEGILNPSESHLPPAPSTLASAVTTLKSSTSPFNFLGSNIIAPKHVKGERAIKECKPPINPQKRQRIITELVDSERRYLDGLKLIQDLYYSPLVDRTDHNIVNAFSTRRFSNPTPVISKRTASVIFSNFLDILSVNSELYKQISERFYSPSWSPEKGCVGDILLSLAPFLKVYSVYVKSFNRALACIESEIKKNALFAHFVKEKAALEISKSLGLQAQLIAPVQRIPRYKLLLEDLLAHTDPAHFDYTHLKAALELITNVAILINETVRGDENSFKLIQLQANLSGFNENLLATPGRRIVKIGKIMKISRKAHHPRILICLNDCLIYASAGILESQLIFHRKMSLLHCQIVSVADTLALQNIFQIISTERSFSCYVNSAAEKSDWLNIFASAKKAMISDTNSFRSGFLSCSSFEMSPSGSPCRDSCPDCLSEQTVNLNLIEAGTSRPSMAPVWMPDESAPSCILCRTGFDLLNRRHHCRICGSVVCKTCSPYTFLWNDTVELRRPQRLCTRCAHEWMESDHPSFRVLQLMHGVPIAKQKRSPSLISSSSQIHKPSVFMYNWTPFLWSTAVSLFTPIVNSFNSFGGGPKEFDDATNCHLCLCEFSLWRWMHTCPSCNRKICYNCIQSSRPVATVTQKMKCHPCSLGLHPECIFVFPDGSGWSYFVD